MLWRRSEETWSHARVCSVVSEGNPNMDAVEEAVDSMNDLRILCSSGCRSWPFNSPRGSVEGTSLLVDF